jgi:hypothetical protein
LRTLEICFLLENEQSQQSQSSGQSSDTRPIQRVGAALIGATLGAVSLSTWSYSLYACHLGLSLGDKTAVAWVKEGEDGSDAVKVGIESLS